MPRAAVFNFPGETACDVTMAKLIGRAILQERLLSSPPPLHKWVFQKAEIAQATSEKPTRANKSQIERETI